MWHPALSKNLYPNLNANPNPKSYVNHSIRSASLAEAFWAWHARTRELCVQVLQHHPWAGIVSPSMTSLPFTPAQV